MKNMGGMISLKNKSTKTKNEVRRMGIFLKGNSFISFTLVIMLLFTVAPVIVVSEGNTDIIPFTDFEDVPLNTLPDGWSYIDADSPTNKAAVVDDDGNKVLKVIAPDNTKTLQVNSPTFDADVFTISYRVKFENTSTFQGLYLGTATTVGFHLAAGNLRFRRTPASGPDNYVIAKSGIVPLQWYNIEMVVYNTSHTVELYIDGEKVAVGSLFRYYQSANPGKADKLYIVVGSHAGTSSSIFIDDLSIVHGRAISDPVLLEVDFANAQKDTAGSFYNANVDMINNHADINFDVADGLFGKASTDRSFYIHNNAGLVPGSKDPFLRVRVNQMEEVNFGRTHIGESTVLSFNCAFDESLAPIRLMSTVLHEGGDGKYQHILFRLSNDGQITAWGKNFTINDAAFRAGEWYNIKLVTNAGDNTTENKNTFSLYFNDRLIAENEEFNLFAAGDGGNLTRNKFMGFTSLWINHNFNDAHLGDGVYKASGFYFDDLSLLITDNVVQPCAMGITHADNAINKYLNYPSNIYVKPETTVEQLQELNIINGTLSAVRDYQGNIVTTGTAQGKYLDILSYDCKNRYVKIFTEREYILDSQQSIVVDETGTTNGSWRSFNNTNGEDSFSAVSGIGGKRSDEESFAIVLGSDLPNADYLNYTIQASTATMDPRAYQPVTLEASVLAEDIEKAMTLQLYLNGASTGAEITTILRLQNGALTITNSEETASYREGEWVRVAVSLYPGKDFYDVWLDGELVAQNVKLANNITNHYVNAIRFAVTAGESIGSIMAFDNVVLYTGAIKNSVAPSLVSRYEELAIVGQNNTITIRADALETENLTEYLNITAETYVLYEDSSMTTVETYELSDGNILVIVKDNIYKYYTLSIPSAGYYCENIALLDGSDEEISIYNMTPGVRSYQITNIMNNTEQNESFTAVIAIYDESKLVGIGISDTVTVLAGQTYNGSITAVANIPEGLTNGSAKVFVINNLLQLKPIIFNI